MREMRMGFESRVTCAAFYLIGLGCELARFRRYTSGFRGVTRTRKISLGLELLLSTTTHWRRSPHLTIHIFFSSLLYHPQNAHTNIVTVSVIASL